MYPNLTKLLIYGSDTDINADSEREHESNCPKLSLPEAKQRIFQNINIFDEKQYKLINKFLEDEQEYVDKLAVLEVQKFDLATLKVPHYDLLNLFGYVEEIKILHEEILPQNFSQIVHMEDILQVFVLNSFKLRVYIKDQWKKSQMKFTGKQALLKRFYNKKVVNDLSLPEQRIYDYLKFHEQLKSNYENAKASDVFQKSFELFNNIYIQMQYVKQAATIGKFPMPNYQNIHLVNSFFVSIDNSSPVSYKVFCMDDALVFTTKSSSNQKNNPIKVEMSIRTDKVSLNANTRDDLCFEMYEHCEKNQKKTYMMVAENVYIRNEWIKILSKILYEQMVVVRLRVKSTNSEGSPLF